MITVTEEARAMLLGLRRSAQAPRSDVGLRLASGASGQLELYADRRREGDHVVKHEETTLLLLSPELMSQLAGTTVDCQATPHGPRLVLDRTARGTSRADEGF